MIFISYFTVRCSPSMNLNTKPRCAIKWKKMKKHRTNLEIDYYAEFSEILKYNRSSLSMVNFSLTEKDKALMVNFY